VWIKNNYGDLYDEPLFRARYMRSELIREALVSARDVDKSELHEVRVHDFAFSLFSLDGLVLRQKVGRWECNNVKEIWQAIMQEGVKISWETPHKEPELFLVEGGALKVTVMGEEYTAAADSVISIPPYTVFSIEALQDGTVVYDCGCSAHLLSMLEDLESVRKNDPQRIDSAQKLQLFMEKYDCFITDYSCKKADCEHDGP
jgi:mannose-6-phosphate isomerase-like protein (cupin superfamily)